MILICIQEYMQIIQKKNLIQTILKNFDLVVKLIIIKLISLNVHFSNTQS